MAGKKIKPTKLVNTGKIHPTISADNTTLRFSFKHLDLNHKKFSIEGQSHDYFHKVLERLKNLSTVTTRELITNRSPSMRSHPIDWENTSEHSGFNHLNSQLRDLRAYQFQISSNAHGRVHGFILENIFFIVWLDPDHSLYP